MKKGRILYGAVCFALGAALCGGGAAYAAGVIAERSVNTFYVDGVQVELPAYVIDGHNYVMLRDVGVAVDFNVYWNGTVQIESDKPYTGVALVRETQVYSDVRQEIVLLANAERRKAGLSELPVDGALMEAAQICAEQGFTDHAPRFECQTAAGCGYRYGFLSNLAMLMGANESDTASRAVKCWMGSPGHRETMMMANADAIGVGVAVIGGTTYCYMLVGDSSTGNPYA